MQEKRKKIVMIGNMNNIFSSIFRYIYDKNYDVELLQYLDTPSHFKPEADTLDDFWNDKTLFFKWNNPIELYKIDEINIKETLNKYDIIIACGSSIAFLNKANIIVDVFIPYGSDIYVYPFFVLAKNPAFFFKRLYFTYHQRAGIKKARNIIMEKQSSLVEAKIKILYNEENRIRTSVPMIYAPQYQFLNEMTIKSSIFYDSYKKIRENFEIVIFHHCRHSWKNPKDKVELKGNDKLFEGFANFKKRHSDVRACIVTLEYGVEVTHTKELVSKLDICESVFWFPLQLRKDIMTGIFFSDIVVGEIYNSYNLYGVIAEALVMGKPVMHNRNDSEFLDSYDELYPMVDVQTASDIEYALSDYKDNKEKYCQMGIQGRNWYSKYIVDKFIYNLENIMK